MFYGGKDQSYMVWPVRGAGAGLAATGQTRCFDSLGVPMPCAGSGQDGATRTGHPWPRPRFLFTPFGIRDRLSGLLWHAWGDILGAPMTWSETLARIDVLNRRAPMAPPWRLPNIVELESLVDCDRHSPALPADHAFTGMRDVYWSSTTSAYETDWAWALYLDKGAVGVGHKPHARFWAWPVRDPAPPARF